jgi:hypothetical protein
MSFRNHFYLVVLMPTLPLHYNKVRIALSELGLDGSEIEEIVLIAHEKWLKHQTARANATSQTPTEEVRERKWLEQLQKNEAEYVKNLEAIQKVPSHRMHNLLVQPSKDN